MALIEKYLSVGEIFKPEAASYITHFALLNGTPGDTFKVTYNSGFTCSLEIPQGGNFELNSEYIVITEIVIESLFKSNILLQAETYEGKDIKLEEDEKYKIQYIKGDKGDSLQWEDLTPEQKALLSFRINFTFFDNQNLQIPPNPQDNIEFYYDIFAEYFEYGSGFYLYQWQGTETIDGSAYSYLFFYNPLGDQGDSWIYTGKFTGPQGEKGEQGLQGEKGNTPKLEAGSISFNEKGLYSEDNIDLNIRETSLNSENYEVSIKLPNMIYFGNPNDIEAQNFPFTIGSNQNTNEEKKQFYFIFNGGSASKLVE